MKRIVGAGLAGATAVAVLLPTAQADAATHLELHARLHHSATYRHATGSADYTRDHHGRDLEISVRAPGLAGRWVTVYAAGHRVGTVHLSHTGYAHREWSTHHRARVPSCRVGSKVRVVRTSNHHLIASGTFYHHAHHGHDT